MDILTQTLASIHACNSCRLMSDNEELDIHYIPILPKPDAKFVFVGRDPSPRTATSIGVRGGKSVFINEVFALADAAGVSEEGVYITDMCKCHWRTSRGTPWPGTEDRSTILPKDIADACIHQWLFQEIDTLNPRVIISFGEELYQQLKEYIIEPKEVPEKLSTSKDKSKIDAELLFGKGVSFKIRFGSVLCDYVPLRHGGNSTSLPRSNSNDIRRQAHNLSKERLIKILTKGKD
jgi:uracil-DNA glycosylase